jgi:tetratricopeptide (TPR) repeat protein
VSIAAMMLVVALALQAQAASAWSTGRPPECRAEGDRAKNPWERAKSPELRRYCDLVASASSKLAGTRAMAEAALASAREAEQVLPGHAAPLVLQGRALAALGKLDLASKAIAEGKARDPAVLDDPLALLAWARVLARTGRSVEAAGAYRALLPRASALSAAERAGACIEAGIVAMAGGTAGLDEAVAALRDGLREAQEEAQAVAVVALSLALDRRGDVDEARALLAERSRGDPRTAIGSARGKELLAAAPVEAQAVAALALEPTDAAGARDAWEKYLADAPNGPWAAHARAHMAALTAGGKRRSR